MDSRQKNEIYYCNGFLHSEVGGWTFAILHKVIEMWPDAGSLTTLCSNN